MLLKRTAILLGNKLWKNLNEVQREKLKISEIDVYEIQNKIKVVLLYISVFATLIAFGITTNRWMDLTISFISFLFIRWWNRGHHFSVDVCYILTVSVIIGSVVIEEYTSAYMIIFLFVSLVLNLVFAPFESIKKHYYTKKIISLGLCTISFFCSDIVMIMWFLLSFDQIHIKRCKGQ